MTDKQTPPDWVLKLAADKAGWEGFPLEELRNEYGASDGGTYRALCGMIERYEQPPVDRKLPTQSNKERTAMTDIAKIAAGLTKAQRDLLLALDPVDYRAMLAASPRGGYVMGDACTWPEGYCQNWAKNEAQPDPWGRVWMHCEEGLSMSNASLARFMSFCLKNNVELGSVSAFQPRYSRSDVHAAVRLKPEQFEAFERETGGRLHEPPKINLNCGGL